jgi:hypothetical protein
MIAQWHSRTLFVHWIALQEKKRAEDRKLETPKDDPIGWGVARQLIWFATDEARQYSRSRSAALQNTRKSSPNLEGVFGLARCMAENRAFIARQGNREKGTVFVGYEQVLPDYRGMVLLDATADIDGLNELCPWRRPLQMPKATYDRLEIVHVPSVAEGTLKRWLQAKGNRREYVQHILDTVRSQVAPGQKALLVCKLDVVDTRLPIEGWSENVKPFLAAKNREFSWDFEGRLLSLTYWGGYGIGANHWTEADVVLLFDDHHLPQHANIAVTQGVKRASATEPPLASMTSSGSGSDDVRRIREGHLLRWTKQMALRGRSREFDENGVCGTQKLVVTSDLTLLMGNLQRVFPGAHVRSEDGPVKHERHKKLTRLHRLLRYLSTPGLPSHMDTEQISDHFGRPWRGFSADLTRHKNFTTLVANAGWRYVGKQGAGGAYFERLDGSLGDRGALGDEGELRAERKRLIDLIVTQRPQEPKGP